MVHALCVSVRGFAALQLAKRVSKLAKKTHKERVNEFNNKLEALSEHHDIPKVRYGPVSPVDSFSCFVGWTGLRRGSYLFSRVWHMETPLFPCRRYSAGSPSQLYTSTSRRSTWTGELLPIQVELHIYHAQFPLVHGLSFFLDTLHVLLVANTNRASVSLDLEPPSCYANRPTKRAMSALQPATTAGSSPNHKHSSSRVTVTSPGVDKTEVKKAHVCPPSTATHPRDRWETAFVYSFVKRFLVNDKDNKSHIVGLESVAEYVPAARPRLSLHVAHRGTRSLRHLRPVPVSKKHCFQATQSPYSSRYSSVLSRICALRKAP